MSITRSIIFSSSTALCFITQHRLIDHSAEIESDSLRIALQVLAITGSLTLFALLTLLTKKHL